MYHSADIVNHFNAEGMKWQANFIREKIKTEKSYREIAGWRNNPLLQG